MLQIVLSGGERCDFREEGGGGAFITRKGEANPLHNRCGMWICIFYKKTTLYNLQTLILSCCDFLIKLPNSIGNLINLRCLDVSGNNKLEEMPSQVGKLKDLQILSNFMVGKNNGLNIKELREMSCLEGELCISTLENVVNVQDVRDADLKLKNNLKRLTLKWSSNLIGSRNDEMENQMNVLHSLQPHSNLGKLRICNTGILIHVLLYSGKDFWGANGTYAL